jgi:hypothetical protein
MKKIILMLILVLHLLPGTEKKGSGMIWGQTVAAQCPQPGDGDPSGCGGGGSFWVWLNNLVSDIATAIGNFFNNAPGGDSPGEWLTDENDGWHLTGDGWLPGQIDYSGTGPYDPWADSYWQQLGLNSDEWNVLNNWQYYYNQYTSGDTVPPPPPPGRYYIKVAFDGVNEDTTKYYEGDTIYTMQRSNPIKLNIYRENGTVSTVDLAWKRNDTAKCSSVLSCNYLVNTPGVVQEKVDNENANILTKNPIIVYKKPTLYFKIGANYDGQYAFDDSTHKYINIRTNPIFSNGYQVIQINEDTAYYVPWLGTLDAQTVIIRDSIKNLSAAAKKDKNGYIELRPEANSNAVINGMNSPKLYFSTLNITNDLSIGARQWSASLDSLRVIGEYSSLIKYIWAITNTGDTVGKLNITCSKPSKKQIVFVYVNTGNGYDSSVLSRVGMLNQLNSKSHNQLFREWQIKPGFSDTLDLSAAYTANPSEFVEANLPNKFKDYYKLHKGIDIITLNQFSGGARSPDFIRFAFISTLNFQTSTINGNIIVTGGTDGITAANFGPYCALFKSATLKTVTHEFGHMLKQDHTWESPYYVPEKTTENYMDYAPIGVNVNFRKFWYGQWIKTF